MTPLWHALLSKAFPDAVWIAKNVPDAAIVVRTSSMAAQMEAARDGVGVLLAASPFADRPGLCSLPLSPSLRRRIDPLPRYDLFLVGHQALRRVPRVAVVWSFLKEKIGAHALAAGASGKRR